MTIYEMLAISDFVTKKELEQAYQAEMTRLDRMKPTDSEEAKLAEDKRTMLQSAYHDSLDCYENGVIPVTEQTYTKATSMMAAIPGPIYCASECTDGCIGECCESCCDFDPDSCSCCSECYEEGCPFLQTIDAGIMIIAALSVGIGLIHFLYSRISEAARSSNERKQQARQVENARLSSRNDELEGQMSMLITARELVEVLISVDSGDPRIDKQFADFPASLSEQISSLEQEIRKNKSKIDALRKKMRGSVV